MYNIVGNGDLKPLLVYKASVVLSIFSKQYLLCVFNWDLPPPAFSMNVSATRAREYPHLFININVITIYHKNCRGAPAIHLDYK